MYSQHRSVYCYLCLDQRSSSTYSHQDPVLRVAKVGLLNRKDTTLDIGKRAKAGKWRLWSVILTSSQLLFFRDHTWATSLQEQMKSMGYRDERILVPPVSLLKPDEMLSLKDSVALFDPSYDKVRFSFVTFYPVLITVIGSTTRFSL
jgi:hypothetical protein